MISVAWLFVLGALCGKTVAGNGFCQLQLAAHFTTDEIKNRFMVHANIAYEVFFRLKEVSEDGSSSPLGLLGNDTFAPDLWVWATGQGKSLLRLPIDHKILSLGLLTLKTASIDIPFSSNTSKCLKELPYESAVHQIGKYMYENVTGNGTMGLQGLGESIVCRSVYAFEHLFYGHRGIGFECCTPGDEYVCDTPYSENFQLVWYGPIILMCFLYLIALGHFYKLYSKSFEKAKVKELLGVVKSTTEIKDDIINRILSNTEKFIRIQKADDLLAMRERIRFLDVLGVGKVKHQRYLLVVRIMVAVMAFVLYYALWAIFLQAYRIQLSADIFRMNDSKTVYLNVVGHIGWVYSQWNLGIYQYALFECVYTAFIPPMCLYLYCSTYARKKHSKIRPSVVNGLQQEFCRTLKCHSVPGRVFQYICAFLVVFHFFLIEGVFLAYVIYMVGLGLISNIDIISPWVIPSLMCLHFFTHSFDSAYTRYNYVKDQLFVICLEDFKVILIKQNTEYFLPRDLIEQYYIPSSRSLVYACIIRVLLAFTALLLLTLVVLTLQYPYNTKLSTLAPFLGVQIIFVLPYLSKTLSIRKPHHLERVLMAKDLKEYVSKYVQERPEMTNVPEEDKESPEKSARRSSE